MTYFFIQGSGFRVEGSGFRVQVAASPQKRKPTPPRCAQQPLPLEGGAPKGRIGYWRYER